MKKIKKTTFLKILIFGFFLAVIFLVYSLNRQSLGSSVIKQTHTVTLTNDGFLPSEITINKGDTIKFINITGKPFWPASNLHPTHGIYPEFDPKEPIEANKEWSYTFEKVGEWKYHDHLSPIYKGKIIVVEGKID